MLKVLHPRVQKTTYVNGGVIIIMCIWLVITACYSGIKYTEKDWVWLKERLYPLQLLFGCIYLPTYPSINQNMPELE